MHSAVVGMKRQLSAEGPRNRDRDCAIVRLDFDVEERVRHYSPRVKMLPNQNEIKPKIISKEGDTRARIFARLEHAPLEL